MGSIKKYAKRITDFDSYLVELNRMQSTNVGHDILTKEVEKTIALYERQRTEAIFHCMKAKGELL